MDDIYRNSEEYNPSKKCQILIVFDDMIADVLSNKKFDSLVTKLLRGRKLNICLAFMTQSYFAVPKKYSTKFYALFYFENFKETRTSTNHI